MFCLLKISHVVDSPVWHGPLDMHTKLQRVWTTTEHRRWWQRQWWIWHIKNYISSKGMYGMTGSEMISRTTSANKAFFYHVVDHELECYCSHGEHQFVYTNAKSVGWRVPSAWGLGQGRGNRLSQKMAVVKHHSIQPHCHMEQDRGKDFPMENCLLSHIYLFSPEMCSDCRATPIEEFSYDAISCLRTRYSCSTFSNVCSSFVSWPGGGRLLNYTESGD
jgi:hypothetical protein